MKIYLQNRKLRDGLNKLTAGIICATILLLNAQTAFAKVPIVSRSQWGADESITFSKEAQTQTPSLDVIAEDKNEKTDDKSADWGKDDPDIARIVETDPETGKQLRWPLQYAKKILYIVVHSTAMSNHLDDPIKDIQSIFGSHANARGWGDIGYNYLIDQKGTVYEGRKGGEKVVGGHAKPVNKVSIGISMMGNYQNYEATAPMLNSLIRMIDEKTRLYHIKPAGKTQYKDKTYNNIMGHYENDATLCPGIYMKEALPIIRDLVEYYQHFYENGDKKGFVLLKKPEVVSVSPEHDETFIVRIRNADSKNWNSSTYLENTNESTLPVQLGRIISPTNIGDVALFKILVPTRTDSKILMPQLRIVAGGVKNSYIFPFPILFVGIPKPVVPVEPVVSPSDKQVSTSNKTTTDANAPVRVRLSDTQKRYQYSVSSSDGVALLNALNKPKITFAQNAIVTVRPNATSGFRITNSGDNSILKSSTPPRFSSAKTGGIMKVNNFEKRPSWNIELNDNTFRGVIELRKETSALYVINELPLEDYMKGLAEVPNADELEKAKALSIAARSYAAYYRDTARKFKGQPYDLDDDPNHTQKYLGAAFEARSAVATKAVSATKGQIITYKGKRVLTPYFNQSDGRTRSAAEVWHWTDAPYLVSVPDTFCGATKLLGHGVGLSGCGATALAKAGKTAEEIIKYYYTGVEIMKIGQ